MIKIKCTYTNGNSIITRINLSFNEAKDYFLGSIFNIGTFKDDLQACVKVESVK